MEAELLYAGLIEESARLSWKGSRNDVEDIIRKYVLPAKDANADSLVHKSAIPLDEPSVIEAFSERATSLRARKILSLMEIAEDYATFERLAARLPLMG